MVTKLPSSCVMWNGFLSSDHGVASVYDFSWLRPYHPCLPLVSTIPLCSSEMNIQVSKNKCKCGIFVGACLIPLNLMTLRSIHIIANDSVHSLFWLSNIPLCICHHISVNCWYIDGHFSWSPILALVSRTTINMGGHVALRYVVSFLLNRYTQ